MDKLKQYLDEQGRGAATALAEATDTTNATITLLKQGKRVPTLKLALAIQEATSGAVPANCWIEYY